LELIKTALKDKEIYLLQK